MQLLVEIMTSFQVKSVTDYSNFDSYPKDKDIPADECTGWDSNF